ncbi:MAG: hypothetical protein Q4A01_00580 [Coriobacteriales bacterium]|nr:hypothetical protein [Coriobacteriales bacterium]
MSLVAALVLVLGLCPAVALAGEVEVEPEGTVEPVAVVQIESVGEKEPEVSVQADFYPLWVGGTQVSVTNKTDIPAAAGATKTGTASYDPDSNTVTLTNYTFDDTSNTDKAIDYTGKEKDLTIVLVGDNSVRAKDEGVYSYEKGIVISGDGTLTAEGGFDGVYSYLSEVTIKDNATVTAISKGSQYSIGIRANSNITISNAEVTAEGNEKGIVSYGTVAITGGKVTATGGKNGISAINGVVVGKDVTKFIASGGTRAFDKNTKVTNAVAGLGWSDAAGTGAGNSIAVNDEGQTLEYKKVQFPVSTYAVSVKADPAEGGKVEASAEKAEEGAIVTLTATATDGYEFVNWTLEGDGAKLDNATTTLTMGAADVTATANFKKQEEKKEEPVVVPDASVTAHVQRIGWMDPVIDGTAAGTTGKSRRVEAVQIQLTGEAKDAYDVYYRVHVQRIGWMAWAKNGEEAGTQGMSRRAEAIQVVLVKKDAPAPDATYKGVTQQYAKAFVKKWATR